MPLTHIEKTIYLKKIPIFQNLTGEELLLLSEITSEVDFNDKDLVFEENTTGNKLFIIIKGRVRIFKTQKGKKHYIADLSQLDYFGEMSLFDEAPHSASSEASGKVQCLTISREGLIDIINEYPTVGIEMLKVLAKRLRQTTDKTI